MGIRIGIGYDTHKLVCGRKLIIGGVDIPYEKGLLGHSDADVLIHAIMDAIIGALGKGDIGKHFPDNDPSFKDIDSGVLLSKVGGLLQREKYSIINIDAIIIAQKPRMAAYINNMQENIARHLGADVGQVNIKATTEEGLGYTGRGEGISAQAVCLIESY